MKKIREFLTISGAGLLLLVLASCSPRVGLQRYSIATAMNTMPMSIKEKLGDFKFYFGSNSAPKNAKFLGKVSAVARTNAWGKSAVTSCNWAFYGALIKLKNRAIAMGANAVANIQSNWEYRRLNSKTEFEADNTFNMSGVALIGDAIKVSGK